VRGGKPDVLLCYYPMTSTAMPAQAQQQRCWPLGLLPVPAAPVWRSVPLHGPLRQPAVHAALI